MAVIRPTKYRALGDFAVPEECEFTDRSSGLEVTVRVVHTDTGLPECHELRLTRLPGGPAVTTKLLRDIAVADLVRQAVDRTPTMRLVDPAKGLRGGLEPLDAHDVRPAKRAAAAEQQRKRRSRITDDDLRWIADVKRRAEIQNRSYITLAQTEYRGPGEFTSDMARQWWRKAREQGYAEEAGS